MSTYIRVTNPSGIHMVKQYDNVGILISLEDGNRVHIVTGKSVFQRVIDLGLKLPDEATLETLSKKEVWNLALRTVADEIPELFTQDRITEG